MKNYGDLGGCYTPRPIRPLRITPSSISIILHKAKPVLGKSVRSDWFFLGQEFAVQTVSTIQAVYFCFGAKPANSIFATKTAKKM